MEKKVGINQRISINVMEMAMKAALDGCFTPEYAADLASGEYRRNRQTLWSAYSSRYPKTVAKRYMKKGMSLTPFTCDRKHLILELSDSADAFVFRPSK